MIIFPPLLRKVKISDPKALDRLIKEYDYAIWTLVLAPWFALGLAALVVWLKK